MSDLTPVIPDEPTRISTEQYFALVESGVLAEDDRVELLEGVIVAVPPPNPPHASTTMLVTHALIRAVGDRAALRTQCPLIAGSRSVPEPDVAIVAGATLDYYAEHPRSALLVVEVSDSSLPQDRLSKSRIYAAAGIPEYWILNLRDDVLEVMRDPDPASGVYRDLRRLRAGDTIELVALPGVTVAVEELIPAPR